MQFFGEVSISAKSKAMTVTLRDLNGASLYRKELAPA
jgi:alkaline phosphatase D